MQRKTQCSISTRIYKYAEGFESLTSFYPIAFKILINSLNSNSLNSRVVFTSKNIYFYLFVRHPTLPLCVRLVFLWLLFFTIRSKAKHFSSPSHRWHGGPCPRCRPRPASLPGSPHPSLSPWRRRDRFLGDPLPRWRTPGWRRTRRYRSICSRPRGWSLPWGWWRISEMTAGRPRTPSAPHRTTPTSSRRWPSVRHRD